MFDFKISTKQDGTWLYFKDSKGKEALINVENMAETIKAPMARTTVLQWCKDRKAAIYGTK